jgi:hypothetical protein
MVRSTRWNGVKSGDVVVVDGVKERRQHWVFVAHVVNEATDAEWVEVRGGRVGEAKGRSFRPEKGSRIVGLSLAQAPQLPIP